MPNYKRTRRACFFTYIAMAAAYILPALLFVTFRESYGVSDTLLGTLVVANFCTQLAVDLVFSVFAKHFSIKVTVRLLPIIATVGMAVFAAVPLFFPQYAYAGLLVGTFIFSVAAGLSEVLISPLVAALPSDNPGRDMSLLHSIYAWGVLFVVAVSSVYFLIFGAKNWPYLALGFAALPMILLVLFCISPLPDMKLGHGGESKKSGRFGIGIWLCVLCIFLGAAAEAAMTNWISAYLESSLQIPKLWGDILGLALFAVLLGAGRVLYAKFGKNISSALLFGMLGASVCYLVAGLFPVPAVSMVACVLTGFCTSMLWPGTLILMEEKFPCPGVAAYALMAAGGDLGCSLAPQILGVISDASDMKIAMTVSALFPILGIAVVLIIRKYFKNAVKKEAKK